MVGLGSIRVSTLMMLRQCLDYVDAYIFMVNNLAFPGQRLANGISITARMYHIRHAHVGRQLHYGTYFVLTLLILVLGFLAISLSVLIPIPQTRHEQRSGQALRPCHAIIESPSLLYIYKIMT